MFEGSILILIGAGLAAGFIAGLLGIGGGLIFAPVLFFYFKGIGVTPEVLAPLTVGSSLFCTCVAALASTIFHQQKGSVLPQTALIVGLFSAVMVVVMTRFVTTQPWYDARVFQVVFSLILLVVAVRLVVGRLDELGDPILDEPRSVRWPILAGTGSLAGAVSAAVGVGGGVILVPVYYHLLRLDMPKAVGTSSGTIVMISFIGMLSYIVLGWNAPTSDYALGYVDLSHAAALALPAVFTARLGVIVAHRIDTRALRMAFALIAALVGVRLVILALTSG